jgi:hypothetical protein
MAYLICNQMSSHMSTSAILSSFYLNHGLEVQNTNKFMVAQKYGHSLTS